MRPLAKPKCNTANQLKLQYPWIVASFVDIFACNGPPVEQLFKHQDGETMLSWARKVDPRRTWAEHQMWVLLRGAWTPEPRSSSNQTPVKSALPLGSDCQIKETSFAAEAGATKIGSRPVADADGL